MGFFPVYPDSGQEKNDRLEERYIALKKRSTAKKEDATIGSEIQGMVSDMQAMADSVNNLSDMADEQKVSFQQINDLSDQCDDDDQQVKELRQKIAMFTAKLTASENLVAYLKTQASNYQYRVSALEEKLGQAGFYSERVSALEDQARKLRSDNHQLKGLNTAGGVNAESPRYKIENNRLRAKLTEYINKQNASDKLVMKMQRKLETLKAVVEQTKAALDESQQRQVMDLEASAVEELRNELERLRQEKEFLESQYVEMRQNVESAAEVSEELNRAKKECAMLEQSYLDLCRELDAKEASSNDKEDLDKLYVPEGVEPERVE